MGKLRRRFPPKLSAGDQHKKKILYQTNPNCGVCNEPIKDLSEANVDHIIPRSRGGRSNLSNLQLTHTRCNLLKGSKLPDGLEHLDTLGENLRPYIYPHFKDKPIKQV